MSKLFTVSYAALLAGMVSSPISSYAEDALLEIDAAAPVAMSRDGQKVTGFLQEINQVTWDFLEHKGFVWDKSAGLSWLSDYDGTDVSKSGVFYAVNNAGMLAGAVKDDALRLPASGGDDFFAPKKAASYAEGDEEKGLPLFRAAVWRDSKVYALEGGLEAIEAYSEETDGSYAIAISEDGNTVIGYAEKSHYPSGIMGWKYNSATDAYDFVAYATPPSAIGASLYALSADGATAFGNVTVVGQNGPVSYPAVWTSPDKYAVIDLPGIETYDMGSGGYAVSADGTKMLVAGSGYSNYYLGIYHVDSGELEQIKLPNGIFKVEGYAITNAGDMFLKFSDSNWKETYYYYDHANNMFMTMAEYLGECASNVPGASMLANSRIVSVTGDGRTMVFPRTDYAGMANGTYVLTLDNPSVLTASAPEKVSLYHSATDKVTCSWTGVDKIAEGITLKGYEVYINGNLVATEKTSEPGGEFFATTTASIGKSHKAYVKTVYEKAGEERKSNPSVEAYAYVSANTQLLSYDNFDDCGVDGNGNPIYSGDEWYVENLEANPMVISWALDVRDWDNNSPFAVVTSIAETPWSTAFVHRYHDATDAEDFFLSFYVRSQEANSLGQDRSTDFLDVEYSTDGRTWKVLKSICAKDMQHSKWNFFKLDLGKELAGKVFQFRFNAHGEGKAMLTWAVDCIGVSDKTTEAAPEGVRMVSRTDKGVELTWQNTISTWDVSHMINSYVEAALSAANQGDPIMMAVDLKPEKLQAHAGEYITSVSAFLYDDPAAFSDPSRVEAVVYEDGKEVARTAFDGPFNTVVSSTAWLPRPVKIEAGKTYRVAVNLARYDANNAPMYYQNTPDCVPGVTDLFSEDGGATWTSMYDAYQSMYPGDDQEGWRNMGNCIWSIHANIVKDPADASGKQKDAQIIGYNVYRNGEQINKDVVYAPYLHFVDAAPLDKASYTVQAFYRDGRVSDMSAPFDYDASSVESIVDTPAPIVYVEQGAIRISGNFDRASLFNMGGVRVATAKSGASIATGDMPAGVYVLRINAGNRVDVRKIVLK